MTDLRQCLLQWQELWLRARVGGIDVDWQYLWRMMVRVWVGGVHNTSGKEDASVVIRAIQGGHNARGGWGAPPAVVGA
jgi:hypothetical protein